MLQNNPELKIKIDQLWNKFWSGGISNPLTAIEQITYLLFMKRLDELDSKAERTRERYKSKFKGEWVPPEYRGKDDAKQYAVDRRTLRWSEFKLMQAEEMLPHVQNKVFPFLKDMNGEESNFTHHMKNAVFIIPKPALLVEAVKTIDEIFLIMEKDSQEKGQAFQDIQGDVYEFLLAEIATAGKNGQFRTPRHIIKLMTELVQPQLGQNIADPACGTGGFNNLKYIDEQFFADLKKGAIKINDILIVKDGATTGKVSFVGSDFPFEQAAINEHLFALTVDTKVAYPHQ